MMEKEQDRQETPEDHLANAEAAEAIGEVMELAGAGTLGELVGLFPGMNPEQIRRELASQEDRLTSGAFEHATIGQAREAAIHQMREASRLAFEAELAFRQVERLTYRSGGNMEAKVGDFVDGGHPDREA